MNQRKKYLTQFLTIFVILNNSERIRNKEPFFTSLHNQLWNITSCFAYDGNKNEAKLIRKYIDKLEKSILPSGLVLTELTLLNMVDMLIENIKFDVKNYGKSLSSNKLKEMDLMQEMIYSEPEYKQFINNPEYSELCLENLDKAEELNNYINKILEEK